MNNSRITYTQRDNGSAEAELAALAAVYAYLIKTHEQKKAVCRSRPDGAKEADEPDSKASSR